MCSATFLAHFIVQIWLCMNFLYVDEWCLHSVVCMCVLSSSLHCSWAFSRGSLTTLVDSSLNVTHYWKTTTPCTDLDPAEMSRYPPNLEITLERRDYICTWRLLPLKIPHNHVLIFLFVWLWMALMLLLLSVNLSFYYTLVLQWLAGSLCLVCIVNYKRLFT